MMKSAEPYSLMFPDESAAARIALCHTFKQAAQARADGCAAAIVLNDTTRLWRRLAKIAAICMWTRALFGLSYAIAGYLAYAQRRALREAGFPTEGAEWSHRIRDHWTFQYHSHRHRHFIGVVSTDDGTIFQLAPPSEYKIEKDPGGNPEQDKMLLRDRYGAYVVLEDISPGDHRFPPPGQVPDGGYLLQFPIMEDGSVFAHTTPYAERQRWRGMHFFRN